MTTPTRLHLLSIVGCALGLLAATLAPGWSEDAQAKPVDIPAPCKDMMSKRQAMQEDAKKQDTILSDHLAKHRALAPELKPAHLDEMVLLMAEQRIARHGMQEILHTGMMAHMASHRGMGANCPMMDPPMAPGHRDDVGRQGAQKP